VVFFWKYANQFIIHRKDAKGAKKNHLFLRRSAAGVLPGLVRPWAGFIKSAFRFYEKPKSLRPLRLCGEKIILKL